MPTLAQAQNGSTQSNGLTHGGPFSPIKLSNGHNGYNAPPSSSSTVFRATPVQSAIHDTPKTVRATPLAFQYPQPPIETQNRPVQVRSIVPNFANANTRIPPPYNEAVAQLSPGPLSPRHPFAQPSLHNGSHFRLPGTLPTLSKSHHDANLSSQLYFQPINKSNSLHTMTQKSAPHVASRSYAEESSASHEMPPPPPPSNIQPGYFSEDHLSNPAVTSRSPHGLPYYGENGKRPPVVSQAAHGLPERDPILKSHTACHNRSNGIRTSEGLAWEDSQGSSPSPPPPPPEFHINPPQPKSVTVKLENGVKALSLNNGCQHEKVLPVAGSFGLPPSQPLKSALASRTVPDADHVACPIANEQLEGTGAVISQSQSASHAQFRAALSVSTTVTLHYYMTLHYIQCTYTEHNVIHVISSYLLLSKVMSCRW